MRCPSCDQEIPAGSDRCPLCTPLLLAPNGGPPSPVEPSASDARHPFAAGRVLVGRYRIVRLLGRGGMGQVYQAEDLKLGQAVALKFLPSRRRHDAVRLELLLNEVRLARQIVHPNVCRVYDVTDAGGLHFLSMEYVDGENLALLLKRIGRLPQERALALALELCDGLEAAHRRGILHRDLKPANLMLDASGHIRINDFGLARLFGSVRPSAPSPSNRVGAGTPNYMAPELHAGGEATVASDLYALGLVLYQLFTGRRGYESTPPEPPSRWVRELDSEVERMILSCVEADPRLRPASAGEVAAALEQKTAPPWHPAPGAMIPNRSSWRLAKRLGVGGVGEAWLAVHRKTRDGRVFKFCREPRHLSALKREITLFRLLKEELGERDDITRILDWNFDESPWFIESEFTESGDLADWASHRGGLAEIPLEERLEIVAQVATALAAAHSIGVLHKDVKPANILIRVDAAGRPRAQLADFGIGAVLEKDRLERAGITELGFTETGGPTPASYAGTRIYTAPELLEGKGATLRADIYALGVLLYQMVASDLSRALAPGWQREVDDPLLCEDIAAAVDGVPERRLADALRLAQRLRTLPERRAERQAEKERRRAARLALERSRRRRRLWLAALTLALLVALAAFFQARQAERAAARSKNATRVAVAGEWLRRDPTRAALLLLEVDADGETAFFGSRIREALRQEVAWLELRGHEAFIRSAAWSLDGSRLLTASYDGTARIWNASNGQLAGVLRGHSGPVMHAAWSPDGSRVATASRDDTARIWNLDEPADGVGPGDDVGLGDDVGPADDVGLGDHVGLGDDVELAGHRKNVQWIAWSHDGSRLATTSQDRTARVWDARGRQDPLVLRGHTDMVWMAAWSPDDEALLTTSYDRTARLWPVGAEGQEGASRVLEGHEGRVWMGAWSPDGQRVATASEDGTARLWPVRTESTSGPVVLGGHGGGVRMAAWSPDGRYLATASEDGRVRIWPVTDEVGGAAGPLGGVPRVLEGHSGDVWSVAWSPDGRHLLSTSKDGTALVWPVAASSTSPSAGAAVVLRGHGGHVELGAWSPDGRWVVTASADMTARIWRPGSAGAEVVFSGREAAVRSITWSADGRSIRTASADGTVRLRPADGGGSRLLADLGSPFLAALWSDGGQRLLAASADGMLRLWSAGGQGEPLLLTPQGEGPHGPLSAAAWSRDGRRVATVAADATVRLWNVGSATGSGAAGRRSESLVLAPHRDRIHAVAWSADSARIATVSEDGTARILSAETGVELGVFGAMLPVLAVAWSPDGSRLLTGLADGRVLAWEVGKERTSDAGPVILQGHTLRVSRIVFSPGGERFATTAAEGRVLVWDFATVRRLDGWRRIVRPQTVLEGHGGRVLAVAWSADGRRLATASEDDTVRIWRLDTGELRSLLASSTRVCLDPEFRQVELGTPPEEAHRRYEDCERARGREPRPVSY